MADHKVNIKENAKNDMYLDLAGELKKQWNMKMTVIPIIIGALGTIKKKLDKGTGRVGNRRTGRGHPNYNITISKNTEKSSGD